MHDPHATVPTALLIHRQYTPALSIYIDKATQNVSVSATQISVTVGTDLLTFDFVGKSLREVAAEISSSSKAVVSNPLANAFLISSGFLSVDSTERTPDGGWVVRMNSHMVRYTEETRIRALMPYSETRLQPWYPRVDRGSVVVNKSGVTYHYHVPEYDDQVWSTYWGKPYVDVTSTIGRLIQKKAVKVARTPIHFHRNNIVLSVNGQIMGSQIVADVDIYNGVILLSQQLRDTDVVRVNYVQEEQTLVYRRINLNPAIEQNPGVLDQTVLLYLLPAETSLGTSRSTTVHHTIGRTISAAIQSIPPGGDPPLVIGAYQVRSTGVVTDVTSRDTRRRGGGIDPDFHDLALKRNEHTYSTSDAGRWDGIPFPGNASGVLLLPKSLLDKYDEELIGERVRRHLAFGGNVLLDFDEALDAPE